MNLEVDPKDVIRLMLQFMKESNLIDSAKALQTEANVSLNTVPNVENFISDIHSGHWDSVLTQISQISLPKEKMVSITAVYEQVLLELLEAGEREIGREFLRTTEPFSILKSDNPDRYIKLEHLCQRPYFNSSDAYEIGSNKEKRRQEIAESLIVEISVVPPSRLLGLITQALRFQQSQGLLPPEGGAYDIWRGGSRTARRDTEEKIVRKVACSIKFPAESHPETAIFSPDGQSLITGSADGFIEVLDAQSCKLRKDLEYQAKDELMMHEDAVLCTSFSREGEFLATGSIKGHVKVWKISTGLCVKRFPQAHPLGITSLCFTRDGGQLLTTSYDSTARLHGMKSGKTLKEFRGHSSFVNGCVITRDGQNLLTCSADGSVRLWDIKTAESLLNFRPGLSPITIHRDTTLHTILLVPPSAPIHSSPSSTIALTTFLSSSSPSSSSSSSSSSGVDHIIVVPKAPHAYLLTTHGQLIKSFNSGKARGTGGDFVCAALSPQGKWLYCVGEDGVLYIFDVAGGTLEDVVQVSGEAAVAGATGTSKVEPSGDVIGIFHHPHRNLLGTITAEGQMKLWKP